MAPSKTSVAAIARTAKEEQALRLRAGGATFDQIAGQLEYADASGAYRAVQRALRKTLQEPADDLRRIEVERLNRLYLLAYRKANDGTATSTAMLNAIEACLRIMERKAKLLGLDAPQRRILDVVTRDAFEAAMADAEAEMKELDRELLLAGIADEDDDE